MNAITPLIGQPALAPVPPVGSGHSGPAAAASTAPAGGPPERRRLSSQALLGAEREIEIDHAGQIYRLRLTSLGKLILTK